MCKDTSDVSDSFRSNYLKINPQITHTLEQLKPSNQDLQCEEKEEEEKGSRTCRISRNSIINFSLYYLESHCSHNCCWLKRERLANRFFKNYHSNRHNGSGLFICFPLEVTYSCVDVVYSWYVTILAISIGKCNYHTALHFLSATISIKHAAKARTIVLTHQIESQTVHSSPALP